MADEEALSVNMSLNGEPLQEEQRPRMSPSAGSVQEEQRRRLSRFAEIDSFFQNMSFSEMQSEVIFNAFDSDEIDSNVFDDMNSADDVMRTALSALMYRAELRLKEISDEARQHFKELQEIVEMENEDPWLVEEVGDISKKIIEKYRKLYLSCLMTQEAAMKLITKEWREKNYDLVKEAEDSRINTRNSNNLFNKTQTCLKVSKSKHFCFTLVIFAAILINGAHEYIFRGHPAEFFQLEPMKNFYYLKNRIVTLFSS